MKKIIHIICILLLYRNAFATDVNNQSITNINNRGISIEVLNCFNDSIKKYNDLVKLIPKKADDKEEKKYRGTLRFFYFKKNLNKLNNPEENKKVDYTPLEKEMRNTRHNVYTKIVWYCQNAQTIEDANEMKNKIIQQNSLHQLPYIKKLTKKNNEEYNPTSIEINYLRNTGYPK